MKRVMAKQAAAGIADNRSKNLRKSKAFFRHAFDVQAKLFELEIFYTRFEQLRAGFQQLIANLLSCDLRGAPHVKSRATRACRFIVRCHISIGKSHGDALER